MNRAVLDFWVGIFVALGICALVFLALRVANQATMTNGQTYSVTAYFMNVGGLKVRSPVKSAGVTVGRVEAVQFDTENYQAKVNLALDKAYAFSKDSSVAILTAGLLGEQYVSIETGAETDSLEEGDVISLTSSAMIIENLIGKFMMSKASEGNSNDSE